MELLLFNSRCCALHFMYNLQTTVHERIWRLISNCFASSPVVLFSTSSYLIASLEKSDHRVEGGILLSNCRVAKSEMWVVCHRKLPWSCSSSTLDPVPSILCTWSRSNIVWLIASADGLRVFSTCFFFLLNYVPPFCPAPTKYQSQTSRCYYSCHSDTCVHGMLNAFYQVHIFILMHVLSAWWLGPSCA